MSTGFPARYWHTLENNQIQCDVCPRRCKLSEGQVGFCRVRQCVDNKLVLLTYGKTSGYAIDPIEKKPLYHFLPNSSVFSFGTIGCNLQCQFCQNWNISMTRDLKLLSQTLSPEEVVKMAKAENCQSVAFTYNEPTIFLEYAVDVAKACHEAGIKTIAVTNGYINLKAAEEFYSVMDAANIDLKSFTEDFYSKITHAHLAPVLDALKYLVQATDTWLEGTTLLMPGYNDSESEINQMTDWIVENLGVDIPWHFTACYPAYKMQNIMPTPVETLERARHIAMRKNMRYVYTGNAYDIEGSTTYCHQCQTALIKRSGFAVLSNILNKDGECPNCGAICNGRWH